MSIKYVEYLESTGDQHIPLKLDFTNNTRIVMDMMVKSTLNSYFLGNAQKGLNKIGNKIGFVGMTGTASNPSYGTLDVRTVMDYTLTGKLYFDGEEVHDFTNEHADYDTESPTYKVAVFGKDDNFEATGFRLYELKWYEGDELVLHLKPCVDNGVGCLYDLVSETYYRCEKATYEPFILGRFVDALYLFANNNEGTAEDLGYYRLYNMKIDGDSEGVESGIDYVDYIYFTDSGVYINTDIYYKVGTRIEFELPLYTYKNKSIGLNTFIACGRYNDICGALNQPNTTNYRVNILDYGYGGNQTLLDIPISKIEDKNYTFSHTFRSSNNGRDDIDKFILGCNNASWNGYIALGKFKIYQNDILVRDFRPCLDTEGVPCMYDEVSKQYFYNQGTGTFGYKKKLRDFQPVLDSNGVPCLMDKINKKYYYDVNGNGFRCDGYSGVSYIKGDGNSWIDTGLIANQIHGYRIETKIINKSANSENTILFGSSQGGFDNADNNCHLRYNYYGYPQGLTFIDDNGTGQGWSMKVNKIYSFVMTVNQPTSSNSFYLCAGNQRDNAIGVCDCGIYYWKVYDTNNNLIQHLIPAIDTNGSIGMYDLVTETFFYNQGSGEFSYGIEEDECPKANYVEYLESNGSGYIDTKIIPKEDYTYEITCTSYSDSELFAYGISGNYNVGAILLRVCTKSLATASNGGITYANWNALKQNEPNTIIMNANHCVLNGVEIATNSEGKQWIKPENGSLYLFGANRWNGAVGFSGKIYEFKITSDSEGIVAHFKPCLDEEGVPCMYDIVSGGYFYKQNGKEFGHGKSIGYTPIKYIEANGTQYIDTGVVVNDNTYMDIDYRAVATEYTQVEYLQGDGASWIDTGIPITTGYDIECNYRHGIPTITGGIFGLTDKNNISISTYPRLRISYIPTPSSNFNYDNNCNASQFTKITHTEKGAIFSDCTFSNANYNCYLFGTHAINVDPGTPCWMTDCFISMFKVWDTEGNLVQHLISVLDSEGTPCMYDLVNEQFHYNQGTGTFSYGNVTPSKNYLMNDFYTDTTYKYKEIDTTVEPNLTASEGATLTLGSTYMSYLSEEELEQATKNGWIIE